MNLAFHPPRLSIGVPADDLDLALRPGKGPSIASALACHNAFGGGSSRSEQKSTNQQATASEGSVAIGSGGKFQEGGVDAAHSSGAKIGSTEVGSGSTITITNSDAEVLTKALDKYAELSSGFGSSLNQFVSQASEDQDRKVATLIGAVDSARESQDSAAQNRKLFLTIALSILALIGLGWFFSRKH